MAAATKNRCRKSAAAATALAVVLALSAASAAAFAAAAATGALPLRQPATAASTLAGNAPMRGLAPRQPSATVAGGWALVALAAAGAALIVQNKGGGHGEIGYHLALNLAKEKGLKVTLIGDSAAKKDKPPFNSYGALEAAGVEVKWADLENGGLAGALEGVGPCEYVFDNENVCTKELQKAVKAWTPKAYAYVSSGGMYKPVKEDAALVETGLVKEENAQLANEQHAAEAGLSWSAFRPQYIYGPLTNKREYIDWFLDRITRDLPVPLPGDGSFRTTLSNAEDVAGMLASVINNPEAAAGQVFNCATDVFLSHKELVVLCAKAAGKDPEAVMKKVVFYDPAALKGVELPKKNKFPFREANFGVSVQKAKRVLAWAPKHTIEGDIDAYYIEYLRQGKDKGDVAIEWDVAVIRAVGA